MVTSPLEKIFGGPPVAVVEAASAIAKLGVNVEVAIFGQNSESWEKNHFSKQLRDSNVRAYFFERKSTSKYGGLPRLRNFVEVWKVVKSADVLTLHQVYNFQNILICLIAHLINKPYAVMPHGSLTAYQTEQHKIRKALVKILFGNLLINRASKLFVATENERNELPQKLQNFTSVVGLGISGKGSAEIKNHREGKPFTFIYLGRLAPKKRIDLALKALEIASEISGNNIKFIICGSGDETIIDEIFQFKNNKSILEIDFQGWVDGAKKDDLMAQSDYFILTSEDENFAIAVAEGLSYGLPCLISKKVAISCMVEKYESGIVFSELDAFLIAQKAVELMQCDLTVLSKNAIEASKSMSWDAVGFKWKTELEKIVNLH